MPAPTMARGLWWRIRRVSAGGVIGTVHPASRISMPRVTMTAASRLRWGGVLGHPAHSHAWLAHGLPWPPATGGWQSDSTGGWCCHVEQGWYGHASRKATWLYVVDCELSELRWGAGAQRIDPGLLERRGYEYARRCGIVGLAGGKRKTEIRNATPPAFRDVLLAIAASAQPRAVAA